MNNSNKDILFEKIKDLHTKPVYTCLEVYSKGNKIYLLKDLSYRLYILIIPQTPLNENQSNTLVNFGYNEIWKRINYEKSAEFSNPKSLNQLVDNIHSIFVDLLNVEHERKWRYDLNTGMAALKNNNTPLLTASEITKKNKKDKKPAKILFNDITFSIVLSTLIFIILLSKNLIDSLTVSITLIVTGSSFILVKAVRFMSKLEISSLGKIRFLGESFSDYFSQNGFKKHGDRYKGQIQGFSVDLMYSDLDKYVIIVYHKEISRDRALNLPSSGTFSSISYDWIGMFYSKKMIKRLLSKEKIIVEAKEFVDLIIDLKIEKQQSSSN